MGEMLGASRQPDTVFEVKEDGVPFAPGGSPHRIGLFETLALARKVELPAPEDVTIVAVEAADCLTVGGPMDARVEAALPVVLALANAILASQSGLE